MTEIRKDDIDKQVIEKVIRAEFYRRLESPKIKKNKFVRRMSEYAAACWITCAQLKFGNVR